MTNSRPRIRRRTRNLRAGGSSGARGRLPDHYDSLPDDPTEDYEDIPEAAQQAPNDQVQDIVRRVAVPPPPARSAPAGPDRHDEDETISPTGRLQAVARNHPEYNKEYRLRLLNRLLLRGIPLDQIAQQFGVSVSTIKRDRAELRRRLREQASGLDVNELVGEAVTHFNEVSGMAMRIASLAKTPTPAKLAALRTSSAARMDMAKFLNTAGVFDVLSFEADDNKGNAGLERLVQLTEELLDEHEMTDQEDLEFEDDAELRLL